MTTSTSYYHSTHYLAHANPNNCMNLDICKFKINNFAKIDHNLSVNQTSFNKADESIPSGTLDICKTKSNFITKPHSTKYKPIIDNDPSCRTINYMSRRIQDFSEIHMASNSPFEYPTFNGDNTCAIRRIKSCPQLFHYGINDSSPYPIHDIMNFDATTGINSNVKGVSTLIKYPQYIKLLNKFAHHQSNVKTNIELKTCLGMNAGLEKKNVQNICISAPTSTNQKTVNINNGTNGQQGPSPAKKQHSLTYPSPFFTTPTLKAIRLAVNRLYRIDDFTMQLIGTGFFSEVFRVTHNLTNETMVLKVNKQNSNRCNVLREIQLMNSLSHPNILKFLGVCVNGGQLHALTEFINGGNLEQLILDKSIALSWDTRINLAIDISKGLSYLHSRRIFHRDLTSKNCLVKRENGCMMAIVADLGLAARIPGFSFSSTGFTRLPIVGSPFWMAPECLHGKYYDEKADIFSFGIILCEMIARIEADPDIMPRTMNFGLDFMAFTKLCSQDVPADLLELAFNCCMIEPCWRPQSFRSIHKLLLIIQATYRDTLLMSHYHPKKVLCDNEVSLPQTFTFTSQPQTYCDSRQNPLIKAYSEECLADIQKFRCKYHAQTQSPYAQKYNMRACSFHYPGYNDAIYQPYLLPSFSSNSQTPHQKLQFCSENVATIIENNVETRPHLTEKLVTSKSNLSNPDCNPPENHHQLTKQSFSYYGIIKRLTSSLNVWAYINENKNTNNRHSKSQVLKCHKKYNTAYKMMKNRKLLSDPKLIHKNQIDGGSDSSCLITTTKKGILLNDFIDDGTKTTDTMDNLINSQNISKQSSFTDIDSGCSSECIQEDSVFTTNNFETPHSSDYIRTVDHDAITPKKTSKPNDIFFQSFKFRFPSFSFLTPGNSIKNSFKRYLIPCRNNNIYLPNSIHDIP